MELILTLLIVIAFALLFMQGISTLPVSPAKGTKELNLLVR